MRLSLGRGGAKHVLEDLEDTDEIEEDFSKNKQEVCTKHELEIRIKHK